MPIERLREQFMQGAQMFYPLGRKKQEKEKEKEDGQSNVTNTMKEKEKEKEREKVSFSQIRQVQRTRSPSVISISPDEDEDERFSEATSKMKMNTMKKQMKSIPLGRMRSRVILSSDEEEEEEKEQSHEEQWNAEEEEEEEEDEEEEKVRNNLFGLELQQQQSSNPRTMNTSTSADDSFDSFRYFEEATDDGRDENGNVLDEGSSEIEIIPIPLPRKDKGITSTLALHQHQQPPPSTIRTRPTATNSSSSLFPSTTTTTATHPYHMQPPSTLDRFRKPENANTGLNNNTSNTPRLLNEVLSKPLFLPITPSVPIANTTTAANANANTRGNHVPLGRPGGGGGLNQTLGTPIHIPSNKDLNYDFIPSRVGGNGGNGGSGAYMPYSARQGQSQGQGQGQSYNPLHQTQQNRMGMGYTPSNNTNANSYSYSHSPSSFPGDPSYTFYRGSSAKSDIGGGGGSESMMSSAEAQKALKDLLGDINGDGNGDGDGEDVNGGKFIEIDDEERVVKGFKEGFRLLDHQVLGRRWMKEREICEEDYDDDDDEPIPVFNSTYVDLKSKEKETEKLKPKPKPKPKRRQGNYGGILADDMGLGKTIQTITRIVEGRARKKDQKDGWSASTLVVCPLALVDQWAEEIKRMTSLKVVKHQGVGRTSNPKELTNYHIVITTYDVVKSEHTNLEKQAKDESATKLKVKAKSKGERGGKTVDSDSDNDGSESDSDEAEHFGRMVKKVVPPKPKATKKKNDVKVALFGVKWFRIILDEAHNIKNDRTKGAIACIKLDGKFRWCLTGTPLQNDVKELFSLFQFLRIPNYSNADKFTNEISNPIKTGRGATRAMEKLQVVLGQWMLRRRKDQLLNGKKLIELPKRSIQVVSCEFDLKELEFYKGLEEKMDVALKKLIGEDDYDDGDGDGSVSVRGGRGRGGRGGNGEGKGKGNYISVLLLLLRLRQACNHPLLVTKDYKKDVEAVESRVVNTSSQGSVDEADDLIAAFGQMGVTKKCKMCLLEIHYGKMGDGRWKEYCVDCVDLAIEAEQVERERPSSAKIRMILKLLKEIDMRSGNQEKTIIFSQFTSMLDLIQPFLKEAGVVFVRYDGSMTIVERDAVLKKLKEDKNVKVILISFRAGSTGLNLTTCNNVILVDLWWNPALEDQAFDRAHRFGQTKDVNIYKLKIDETVEERILLLQEKKRMLAAAALSGDKLKNMTMGMDELLALFRRD